MTYNEKKNQWIETIPELTHIFELADNDIEAVILTVFHMDKTLRHGRFL